MKELILKIKETLKELEKYNHRLKCQEAQINRQNFTSSLNEYVNKYSLIQILEREIDSLQNKEYSAISKKTQERSFLHYDSDSNSQLMGTPPKKSKTTKSPPLNFFKDASKFEGKLNSLGIFFLNISFNY